MARQRNKTDRESKPSSGFPPEETQEARLVQIQAAMFSGPLPPPNALARYNEIVPNGADRIMAMAERQAAHRERLESQVVESNVRSRMRGVTYGFVLALVVILAGCFLIYKGKDAQGFAAIIATGATLAGTFVLSQRSQRRELDKKNRTLENRRSEIARRRSN